MNDQIMRALIRSVEDQAEEEDRTITPMLCAQAEELKSRWTAAQQVDNLPPGTLVLEKPGLGCLVKKVRRTQLLIVWRMLDLADPIDQALIMRAINSGLSNTDRPDCLVGEINYQGGAPEVVSIYAHHLSQLRRWDGTEPTEDRNIK